MKRYIVFYTLIVLVCLTQTYSFAEEIPDNPDSFTLRIRDQGKKFREILVKSNKMGSCIEYNIVHVERHDDSFNLKSKLIKRITIKGRDIDGFINILNYTDFLNLKDFHVQTFGNYKRYILKVVGRDKSIEHGFNVKGYSSDLCEDKNLLRILFYNEYLDSMLFYRKNGKLNVWRDVK